MIGLTLCRRMPDGSIRRLLINETEAYDGLGKLTKALTISGDNNHRPLTRACGLWIEAPKRRLIRDTQILATPRIGINYAGPHWSQVPYRFVLKND